MVFLGSSFLKISVIYLSFKNEIIQIIFIFSIQTIIIKANYGITCETFLEILLIFLIKM
jgi:hypothetical protein